LTFHFLPIFPPHFFPRSPVPFFPWQGGQILSVKVDFLCGSHGGDYAGYVVV
jgi:hypothetical protein